jgi:hypothetical protein
VHRSFRFAGRFIGRSLGMLATAGAPDAGIVSGAAVVGHMASTPSEPV